LQGNNSSASAVSFIMMTSSP